MTLKSKVHHEAKGAGLALSLQKEASALLGAGTGAALGGLIGYDSGKDNKMARTLTGAGLGAATGGAIGHFAAKAGREAGAREFNATYAKMKPRSVGRTATAAETAAKAVRKRKFAFHEKKAKEYTQKAKEASERGDMAAMKKALKMFRKHMAKTLEYVG